MSVRKRFVRTIEEPIVSSNSDSNFLNSLAYFPNIPIKNPDGSWHRLSAMPALTGAQGRMDKTIDDFLVIWGIEINTSRRTDGKR